jgi:serine/threonine protein kinase
MSHDALALPRPFGPYLLLRRLAVGGMAEVYVARARGISGFEKLVAIKVIHPRYSEDQHFTDLLVEEAKISVLLTHVNIGQIFDLGIVDGTYYIALEYIEGADAFRLLRKAGEVSFTLPLDVCMFIAAEVCHGLDYAHRKRDAEGRPLGIVHRDISPQNVLVSFHGEVKIVDFGIAKAALRTGQTEAGVIKGKYYYMSPEQAWGDPMDHRSDIFSAGIVLYELLIGEMLYREDSIPALLDRVRKADIAPPARRRADVPPALSAIVMRALAREPERRFQSAHEMAQALMQLLYAMAPSFTASRVADVMQQLFPEELQRTAELASRASATPETGEGGPPSTLTAVAPRAPLGGAPTRVAVRAPASRPEEPSARPALAPAAFALGDDDDDDLTRNDVPALQRAMAALVAGDRAGAKTAPIHAPVAAAPGAQTNTDEIDPGGMREEATRAFASARPREVSTRSLLTPDGAPRDVWDDEDTSILSARRLSRPRGAAESEARASRPDESSDAGWSEESTVIEDGEAISAARAFLRGERAASSPPSPAPRVEVHASATVPADPARPSQRPAQARAAQPAGARLPAPQPRGAPGVASRPPASPAPAAQPSAPASSAPGSSAPAPSSPAPSAPASSSPRPSGPQASPAGARPARPAPERLPAPQPRAAAPASVLPPSPRARPSSSVASSAVASPPRAEVPPSPMPATQPPEEMLTPRRDAAPAAPQANAASQFVAPQFAPPPPAPEPWASPSPAPEPWASPAAAPEPWAVSQHAPPTSSEPWPSPPAAPEPWAAPPWAGGSSSPLAVAPPREPFPTGATGPYAAFVEQAGGRRRALWLGGLGLGLLVATFAGVSVFLTSRPEPKPTRVTSVPMGAQVQVDGVAVPGLTPLVLTAPLDPERAHTIDVTLDGFHPYRIEVPSGDKQPEHLAILTPR